MQIVAKYNVYWTGDKWSAAIKEELANRVERVGELLKTAMQKNLSVPGDIFTPSEPGEFPHAVTRNLAKRVISKPDRRKLVVYVGVPAGYYGDIAYWLEFGTGGPVEIRPVNAKALMIPISESAAAAIMSDTKLYKRGKSGKIIKAGNSRRKLMRRAGIVTYRGKLYLLRSFVKRGPMAQRSFLRRTLEEMKPTIMMIMTMRMRGGFSTSSWTATTAEATQMPG